MVLDPCVQVQQEDDPGEDAPCDEGDLGIVSVVDGVHSGNSCISLTVRTSTQPPISSCDRTNLARSSPVSGLSVSCTNVTMQVFSTVSLTTSPFSRHPGDAHPQIRRCSTSQTQSE